MSRISSIIDIILRIVNICFSSGVFPTSYKSANILPLFKKQSLYPEILTKNTGLSFISKMNETYIVPQIHSHLISF